MGRYRALPHSEDKSKADYQTITKEGVRLFGGFSSDVAWKPLHGVFAGRLVRIAVADVKGFQATQTDARSGPGMTESRSRADGDYLFLRAKRRAKGTMTIMATTAVNIRAGRVA